jgi:hypothetical protein
MLGLRFSQFDPSETWSPLWPPRFTDQVEKHAAGALIGRVPDKSISCGWVYHAEQLVVDIVCQELLLENHYPAGHDADLFWAHRKADFGLRRVPRPA